MSQSSRSLNDPIVNTFYFPGPSSSVVPLWRLVLCQTVGTFLFSFFPPNPSFMGSGTKWRLFSVGPVGPRDFDSNGSVLKTWPIFTGPGYRGSTSQKPILTDPYHLEISTVSHLSRIVSRTGVRLEVILQSTTIIKIILGFLTFIHNSFSLISDMWIIFVPSRINSMTWSPLSEVLSYPERNLFRFCRLLNIGYVSHSPSHQPFDDSPWTNL